MSSFSESKCLKHSERQKCNNFHGILHSAKITQQNDSHINTKSTSTDVSNIRHVEKMSEGPVSLGADVYVSDIAEEDSDSFNLCSSEFSMLDFNYSINESGEHFEDGTSFENNKTVFCNTKKNPKTGFFNPQTFNLGFSPKSSGNASTSKQKSSPNFAIFGQVIKKKPTSNSIPRNSANSNSQAVFESQNSPCHVLKDDLLTESNDGAQRAQMKTKLRSMWNNMKYGWRVKREVNLKTDSAIWLLGECYHNKSNDDSTLAQDVSDQLRLDLLSKIWLTYRINFPVIPGTNLVTDSGWGCMLRSGQMMMAQAFVCHFLQRDWRLSSDQPEEESKMYKMILRWFGDTLSEKSPFSLHHLVSLGENYGRKAGDWYGPTHAAHVLRDALIEAKKQHPQLEEICMYVASDGIVFKQDVVDLCTNSTHQEKKEGTSISSISSEFENISLCEAQRNSDRLILRKDFDCEYTNGSSNLFIINEPFSYENACPSYSAYGPPSYNSTVKPKWKSLILFVSVRLGNDKINPFYIPCLKSLLAYKNCIGIIGGRPKHALYFIGYQEDKIIHMDPHSCQPAVDVEKDDFSKKSFHSSSIRTMSFTEMDPSCAIGFYFREHKDFQYFVEKFSEITAPLKKNLEYPVFALADGKRNEIEDNLQSPHEKCFYSRVAANSHVDDEDDDYILL